MARLQPLSNTWSTGVVGIYSMEVHTCVSFGGNSVSIHQIPPIYNASKSELSLFHPDCVNFVKYGTMLLFHSWGKNGNLCMDFSLWSK